MPTYVTPWKIRRPPCDAAFRQKSLTTCYLFYQLKFIEQQRAWRSLTCCILDKIVALKSSSDMLQTVKMTWHGVKLLCRWKEHGGTRWTWRWRSWRPVRWARTVSSTRRGCFIVYVIVISSCCSASVPSLNPSTSSWNYCPTAPCINTFDQTSDDLSASRYSSPSPHRCVSRLFA